MKNDHYYQFPISALTYDMQHDSRWEHVLFYACLHYGRKAVQKTPPHAVMSAIKAYMSTHSVTTRYPETHDQTAVLFGLQRLKVRTERQSPQRLVELATRVEQHCAKQPYPQVRIRANLWWKTFEPNKSGMSITYREFCVLCAVYALVGDKPYVKASLDRIRHLAAGALDRARFQHVLNHPETTPGSLLLSTRQARTTLDNLEVNRFFAKFTYNRGECFFSHRMNRSELQDAVAKYKLRKQETLAVHRALDCAASIEIQERLKNCSLA